MANEENHPFENLSFNPFCFESILPNTNQDPDENLINDFKSSSYSSPSELKNILESLPLKTKSFSIISFNIRSMKNNFEEFRDFIHDLSYDFSVISLTETWCLDDPRNESLYKLNNYASVHQA